MCETVVPKLVAEDIPLLHSLLTDVFPGVKYRSADVGQLKAEIAKVCAEMYLVCGDNDSSAAQWLEKVLYAVRCQGAVLPLPLPR